ncbi:G-protein coupled receptor [Plakobranchus ocellatus]|uniref:G-protein coupled receptor n=1 Tax=Plakobranchus ocellatus TaxID=259542 RepID=A0AAV4B5P9_9GAST|nr:G-protein coupled receptor [Plakobranchus ocellatus]
MKNRYQVEVSSSFLSATLCLLLLVASGHGDASENQPGSYRALIQLSLSQHPGRVYPGAPPGLPVLQVTGVHVDSGEPVREFHLEPSTDSIYFMIDSAGYIRTRSNINFSVGKKFGVMVAGLSHDKVGYKYVEIVVSVRNEFPPVFTEKAYSFQVYRRAAGVTFGYVMATDRDVEPYNRNIDIRAAEEYLKMNDTQYVSVSSEGALTLEREVDQAVNSLTLTVQAIDSGSPQKTGTANARIELKDIQQPDTFCFSTTWNTTTLCWKNPMPDRNFSGYHITFKGEEDRTRDIVMPWVEGHQEMCYTVQGTKLGSQYSFSVSVAGREGLESEPQKLVFNKSAIGYSQECVDESFSVCNYRDPCMGHGSCHPDPRGIPGYHQCFCDQGWRGENCTLQNQCDFTPCEHGGTCIYKGDTLFECECPQGYLGKTCEHYNHCMTSPSPCENGALCLMHNNGSYSCNCLLGFGGDFCEYPDPCTASTCIVDRSECRAVTNTTFRCECKTGYYGEMCEFTDACVLNHQPCKNQGTCLTIGTHFKCLCTNEWHGELCELANPCAIEPCVHGTCSIDPVIGSYRCACFDGYKGNECQDRITPCDYMDCGNKGKCQVLNDVEARCICEPGYLPPNCLEFDPCTNQPCAHEGLCTRIDDVDYTCTCIHDWLGKNCQTWNPCLELPPVCGPEEICELRPEHGWPSDEQVTYTCIQKPVTTTEASPPMFEATTYHNPASPLHKQTENPSQVTPDVFRNVTEELIQLFDHSLQDIEVARTSIEVISNLANVNFSVSEESANLSTQLREFIDNYTGQVEPDAEGQMNISTSQIAVKTVVLQNTEFNQSVPFTFSPSLEESNETEMTITLPREVTWQDSNNTRLQLVAYSRSQLFVPEGGFSEEQKQEGIIARQRVISAAVGNRPIANLSEPVVIRLVKINKGDANESCAYWDERASAWKTDGIEVVEQNDSVVICHSYHLTNFAVLMAPTQGEIPRDHAEALTAITWAGCAISMACLVLTILTYGLFKCLHGEKSGKTLLNLCSALLLLNIMFLVGSVDVSGYSRSACVAVAMLVHYALLASLMWMLVEAVDMYQALVTVFNKYQHLYLLKRCIAAWGLPVVIVSITGLIDTNNYYRDTDNTKDTKICLMTAANGPAYYAALLGPGCLIVLINTVVFILVARVILKPKFQHQQSNKEADATVTVAQIRGAFMVMILLGVTWLFGPLAIDKARLLFSYIFCICNSLQGCLIFLFRCLLNPEAQLAWKQLFLTGTLKRRRGPIRSTYTDSSSKSFGNTGGKPVAFGTGDRSKGAKRNSTDRESAHLHNDSRKSVATLLTTGNLCATSSDKAKKGCVGYKNPKANHAHPHQLHRTNGWHPNLNGPPREESPGPVVMAPPVCKDLPQDAAYLPYCSTDSSADHAEVGLIDSKDVDCESTKL